MAGGPSEGRVFDLKGKALPALPTEPVSSAGIGVRLGGDDVLFGAESFVKPFAWYRYTAGDGKLEKTALAGESKVSFDHVEVSRAMPVSKDATKLPPHILMNQATKPAPPN